MVKKWRTVDKNMDLGEGRSLNKNEQANNYKRFNRGRLIGCYSCEKRQGALQICFKLQGLAQ